MLTVQSLAPKLKNMEIKNESLVYQIERVINKFIFLEKKRKFSFKGIDLYPSEIHLMFLVKEKQATNATKMAEKLGVTKGAVSQALSRLEKKKILIKTKDPYAKNELTVSFTPLGEQAVEEFWEMKNTLHKQYDYYLATLPDNECDIIQRFLTYLEELLSSLQ